MLLLCVVLLYLSCELFAVELSIYKSFTEVRQNHNAVGDYLYQLNNGDYENIIDGSISWEGTPFVRQELYSTVQSLQDAKVTVRRSSSSSSACETIEAKIVDPKSMLLENLKTGSYFYADKQQIEYQSVKPNDASTTLSFQFATQTTEHNGTLIYLTKGLSWKPSYDLLLTDNNQLQLRAYANIKNDQQREFIVEKTNLLGGDVQLANGGYEPIRGRFESMSKAVSSNLRPIESTGEQQGLYSYSLNDQYTLRPSSYIRLPFIQINANYQFYYQTITNIAPGQSKGVFQRNYDITPDQFMPAGVITVRDQQVLVGQANLPDVPQNYKETFSTGEDRDIRYTINANLTQTTTKPDDNTVIQTETYFLDVQINNYKNKDVNTRFILQGGQQISLLATSCPSVDVQANQLQFSLQLKQGQNQQCNIFLTLQLS